MYTHFVIKRLQVQYININIKTLNLCWYIKYNFYVGLNDNDYRYRGNVILHATVGTTTARCLHLQREFDLSPMWYRFFYTCVY